MAEANFTVTLSDADIKKIAAEVARLIPSPYFYGPYVYPPTPQRYWWSVVNSTQPGEQA